MIKNTVNLLFMWFWMKNIIKDFKNSLNHIASKHGVEAAYCSN